MKNRNIIKVSLKSFDHKPLDEASKAIVIAAKKSGAKVCGPIPMPTKTKKFTVIKGPHVDKRSGEEFKIQIFKRSISIYPTQETVEALTNSNLSLSGVDVSIKINELEFNA